MAPQPRDWSYNFCRGERQVFSVSFCLATRGEAEYFLAAVASASERFPCHASEEKRTHATDAAPLAGATDAADAARVADAAAVSGVGPDASTARIHAQ
jgi:hypothetical protein